MLPYHKLTFRKKQGEKINQFFCKKSVPLPAPSCRWQWQIPSVLQLSFTRQRSGCRRCCWHCPLPTAQEHYKSSQLWYGSIVNRFKHMSSAGQLKTQNRQMTVHFGWFVEVVVSTFCFSGLGQDSIRGQWSQRLVSQNS